MVVRLWKGTEDCLVIENADRILLNKDLSVKVRFEKGGVWTWTELKHLTHYDNFVVSSE